MKTDLTIHGLHKPTRLDRVLRNCFPQWGRQTVQRLITAKKVKINGQTVWLSSWEIKNGDRVEITETPEDKPVAPQHFDDAWLLAVEDDLIAVNKPAGLLTEPARWRTASNLLELAQSRFGPLIAFHRLDRDTSGVVLLTRPGPINQYLDHAFKTHTVRKEYVAVVHAPNQLAEKGIIKARLAMHPKRRDRMAVVERGGQQAITYYEVEKTVQNRQYIRLWPETGRTHQLRVHLAYRGAPVLGDRLYGFSTNTDTRLMLHAYQIRLPVWNHFPERKFVAPIPFDF